MLNVSPTSWPLWFETFLLMDCFFFLLVIIVLCGNSVFYVFVGPVGMAAAAAVATGKKRKRPHIFESNPSIRKRQQTRLLR